MAVDGICGRRDRAGTGCAATGFGRRKLCGIAAKNSLQGTIVPRIDGQAVEYFLNQWNSFDGDRKGSIASQMKLLMYSYTPDQMRAVAEIARISIMPHQPSEEVLDSDTYKRGLIELN